MFFSWEGHWVSGVFGSQMGMSEQQLFGSSSSILSLPCIGIFSPFQERTFGLVFDHISVHATFLRCLDVCISEVK